MGARGRIPPIKLPVITPEMQRRSRAVDALKIIKQADKLKNDKALMSDIAKLKK